MSEVVLPVGVEVPEWAKDHWRIAEEVQRIEKRKDARYYKEQEVSLPICLTMEQRIELTRKFVREQVADARGMVLRVLDSPIRRARKAVQPRWHHQ